jgi:hypothetical protein
MGLKPKPRDLGEFEDKSGKTVFFDPSVGSNLSSAGLINREKFLELLRNNKLECLWIVAGEKSVHFSHDTWGRRCHSGVYRYERHRLTGNWWYEDDRRGLEKHLKKKASGLSKR